MKYSLSKPYKRAIQRVLISSISIVVCQNVMALDLEQYPRLKEATAPLISKGIYSQVELNEVFKNIELREEVIKRKANAAEKVLTWGKGGTRGTGYKGIFLQKDRIQQGAQFWRENKTLMDEARADLGLNGAMIASIIGVETKYGQNKGSHLVLESIATHASRGSKLQFGQLPIFLTLVKEGHLPVDVKGSYSGALGIPQFISSSYRDFGIDFDNDGRVDLVSNTADAIGSVANYFKRHDWKPNNPVMQKVTPNSAEAAKALDNMAVTKINSRVKPKTTVAALKPYLADLPTNIQGSTPVSIFKFLDENDQAEYFFGYHNFYVIMRYNHSALYARAIHELSQEIAKAY